MRSSAKKLTAGVLLVSGLALAACGDDSGSSAQDDTTTTTAADAGSTTTAAGAAGGATVSVVTEGELGAHLVGADGHTLYVFEKDKGTTTACTGGCADTWPGVAAASPTGGAGIDAGKLSTADGQVPDQVVYAGHLLYEFAGDTAPGDTNGTKVPSWYAVGPDGSSIGDDD